MKRVILYFIFVAPYVACTHSYAEPGCERMGGYIELSLLDAMEQELGINLDTVRQDKTTVELIDVSRVSSIFARQMARSEYEIDRSRTGKAILQEQTYYSDFIDNNVINTTAKYTYTNNRGRHNVFIASGLSNDDECSVRFNGYLILSREF